MKVPNYEHAIIPERKITAYLLSLTHHDGRSKAIFFMRFGFTSDNWEVLANALRQHVADYEVANIEDTRSVPAIVLKARYRRQTVDYHRFE